MGVAVFTWPARKPVYRVLTPHMLLIGIRGNSASGTVTVQSEVITPVQSLGGRTARIVLSVHRLELRRCLADDSISGSLATSGFVDVRTAKPPRVARRSAKYISFKAIFIIRETVARRDDLAQAPAQAFPAFGAWIIVRILRWKREQRHHLVPGTPTEPAPAKAGLAAIVG